MKIFDVANKARVGFWCAAPNADAAIDIAYDAGHARARANLRATDVTEAFSKFDRRHHDGVDDILNGKRTGHVVGVVQALTMRQVLSSKKETAKTCWIVQVQE